VGLRRDGHLLVVGEGEGKLLGVPREGGRRPRAPALPHDPRTPSPTIYDQLGRHYSGKGHVIYTIKGSEI